jgi:hypothetical protein
LTHEDVTDTLSRNVDNQSSIYAAQNSRTAKTLKRHLLYKIMTLQYYGDERMEAETSEALSSYGWLRKAYDLVVVELVE